VNRDDYSAIAARELKAPVAIGLGDWKHVALRHLCAQTLRYRRRASHAPGSRAGARHART
jgi:hypothetical protein